MSYPRKARCSCTARSCWVWRAPPRPARASNCLPSACLKAFFPLNAMKIVPSNGILGGQPGWMTDWVPQEWTWRGKGRVTRGDGRLHTPSHTRAGRWVVRMGALYICLNRVIEGLPIGFRGFLVCSPEEIAMIVSLVLGWMGTWSI